MAAALDNLQYSTGWQLATQKRQRIALFVLVLTASLIVARLVLVFDLGAIFAVATWLTVMMVVVQPRYGVYLMLALVLPFENGDPKDNPFKLIGFFVNASPQTSFRIPGLVLTPLETLVVVTCVAWLAQAAIRHQLHVRGGTLGVPVLIFGLSLLWGVFRGQTSGGDFNSIMWESRFLFAMVLCYVVTANTIRTRAHVTALLAWVFVGVSLSGVEAVWRKYALADTGVLGPVQEFWYSHEDVVIWGLIIFLVLGRFAYGGSRWQRVLGPPLVAITVLGMLVSERRAGYIAVIVAFVAFAGVLFMARRRAFWFIALPVLLAGAVYMPLFWNSTGTLGQPARAVRSINDPDPRDAASNVWRDLEAINVRATIQADPLLGIGFGKPFLQVVQVPSIAYFALWNYESHHDILWVWMKTGAIGFISFFMIMLGGIARSAWIVRNIEVPDYRVLATLTLSAVVMSLVFCYVDLGLTGSRVPMMLGILLGALAVVPQIYKQERDALQAGFSSDEA